MPSIVLQQVSNAFARTNVGKTLEKPIALEYVQKHLSPEKSHEIDQECPERKIYVWGSKSERVHQYGKIPFGQSVALFRRNRRVYKCGVIMRWLYNPALGEYLWGQDADGETWSLVYLLKDVKDISIPASEVNELIGRKATDNWQGLTAVTDPDKAQKVIDCIRTSLGRL